MNSSTFTNPREDAPQLTRTYTKRKSTPTEFVAVIQGGILASVYSSDSDAQVVAIDCDDKKASRGQIDFAVGNATEGISRIFSN